MTTTIPIFQMNTEEKRLFDEMLRFADFTAHLALANGHQPTARLLLTAMEAWRMKHEALGLSIGERP
jgi:hypothetical protein